MSEIEKMYGLPLDIIISAMGRPVNMNLNDGPYRRTLGRGKDDLIWYKLAFFIFNLAIAAWFTDHDIRPFLTIHYYFYEERHRGVYDGLLYGEIRELHSET